jgi:hypothetical protein
MAASDWADATLADPARVMVAAAAMMKAFTVVSVTLFPGKKPARG